MVFKNIPINTEVLFNGHFAIKVKPNCIHIPRLGVNGFLHISEDEDLEVIDEKEKDKE